MLVIVMFACISGACMMRFFFTIIACGRWAVFKLGLGLVLGLGLGGTGPDLN